MPILLIELPKDRDPLGRIDTYSEPAAREGVILNNNKYSQYRLGKLFRETK